MATRKCSTCKVDKTLDSFRFRTGDRSHQLRSECRACENTRNKKWQAEHRDSLLSYKKQKKKENRGLYSFYELRRKYRKRSQSPDGLHTVKDWLDLIQKYEFKCLACGEHKKLTEDHIVPIASGGSDYIENIQPLCLPCNRKKNNKIINYREIYDRNNTCATTNI